MNNKEIRKYKKYLKIRSNKKVNWFNRIRFWKYLKKDYDKQVIENARKNEEIHNLKIKLEVAEQSIQHLESDARSRKRTKVTKCN